MISRTLEPAILSLIKAPSTSHLLLSGAKNTGKHTLMEQVGKSMPQWMMFDMTHDSDRILFESGEPDEQILNALFFIRGKDRTEQQTLIFMKEIQTSSRAVLWFLRMISSGQPYTFAASTSYISPEISLLTSSPQPPIRVIQVPPLTFLEFLQAYDDPASLNAFLEVPVPFYAYENLLNLFHIYSLIGGMPEIVSAFILNRDIKELSNIYDDIFLTTNNSIADYAPSGKTAELTSEIFLNAFPYAATRIMFHHFGNSLRGSREIAKAFRTLEHHMQLRLIYPVTSTKLPVENDQFKSPRIHLLDTGMVNYFSGIQNTLFGSHDMNAIFEGQIARQVVGQELAAQDSHHALHFWVRNKLQSTAEVDFIIPYLDLLIPVVVKSGEPGRLRSLHLFVDEAPHPYAVRLSAGKVSVTQSQTLTGKKFYLLNLPYFLASKIREHLQGFIRLATG